jgi:lipid-A-disaccharide synthase
MRVAIVAGEASGDQLGAAFMEALRQRVPGVEVRGVAGPRMLAAGCAPLAQAEELAVMGLFEVLSHLPRLWRLRRRLVADIAAWQPDVFVGIDAPSFNLGLGAQLKHRGLRCVQYVSPQVWAWREHRVREMGQRCDLVLCLLPFEPKYYAGQSIRAEFVGHPLADQIALPADRIAARAALRLPLDTKVLALLPGSRRSEVLRLAPDFIAAAQLLQQRHPGLVVLAPMASDVVRAEFERALAANGDTGCTGFHLLVGQARLALQAADVALVASGTAALEALLCGCPMTVAYRFQLATIWLVRLLRLFKLPFFSLPNLLAGEALVPEFLQEAVTPSALAAALGARLADPGGNDLLRERYAVIHRQLRVGGAGLAADAVVRLVRGA